jgi:hypothetical protein
MDEPDSTIHTLHTLWSLILSAAGALLMFFLNRTIKQLDGKAEKSEVAEVKDDIKNINDKLDKISDTQAQRHEANTRRLDNILFKINGLHSGD